MTEPSGRLPSEQLPSERSLAFQAALKPVGQAASALRAVLGSLGEGITPIQIRIAFARAGRQAGVSKVEVSDSEATPMGLPRPLGGWAADQLARIAVLLAAIEQVPVEQQVSLVETLYRTGGDREQQSVLRALTLLPEPGRYCDLAAEATRTNAVTVFAALACENSFPAAYMPDLNFNQMVLKAVFLELDTSRILCLVDRVTPELVRMLQDYAAERGAAGRSIPPDVDRITQLLTRTTEQSPKASE